MISIQLQWVSNFKLKYSKNVQKEKSVNKNFTSGDNEFSCNAV